MPDIGMEGAGKPVQARLAQLLVADYAGMSREYLDHDLEYLVPRLCHHAAKPPLCKEDRCVLRNAPECPYWHANKFYGLQLLKQARATASTLRSRRTKRDFDINSVGKVPARGEEGRPGT